MGFKQFLAEQTNVQQLVIEIFFYGDPLGLDSGTEQYCIDDISSEIKWENFVTLVKRSFEDHHCHVSYIGTIKVWGVGNDSDIGNHGYLSIRRSKGEQCQKITWFEFVEKYKQLLTDSGDFV